MPTRLFLILIAALALKARVFSEGLDIPVKPSREGAWTPEQSLKSLELDGPYEVQLVACEPLVRDPVEMCWDAKGRCFVADMIDYPLGAPEGQKPLSRIVQLLDPDKNGRYTRALTFAKHMDNVQGLLPYKDGLIATTRTQILFLRDTNGDGKADQIKPLIEGFNPQHSQLQVSAPRWGLDNCVYFNNGLNAQEIYPTAGSADSPVGSKSKSADKTVGAPSINVTRCNLRWDPATGKVSPTTGYGQFGGCFDDWGRHFFCSNRSPVMFAVMPYEAVIRNPHAGITQGWEDIAPSGAESRVYPLQLTHTTADAHAGTNTAACGLGVYRGDLIPELRGNIFVCDPTGQLVTRYTVEPNGASLKATRVGNHTEFFRSHDEWCRPVNVTTGPDGALYICDIYRRYIDHARYFPEEFAKTHDLRAGEHEGRIWRVVPRSTGLQPVPLRAITAAPEKLEELVAWLGHPNAWQRETAQRLLVEMQELGPEFMQALRAQPYSALLDLNTAAIGMTVAHRKTKIDTSLISDMRGESYRGEDGVKVLEYTIGFDTIQEHHYNPYLTWEALMSNNARGVMWGAVAEGLRHYVESTNGLIAAGLRFSDDVWIHRAMLSSSQNRAGVILTSLLCDTFAPSKNGSDAYERAANYHAKERVPFAKAYSLQKMDFIRSLASCSAADGNTEDFTALFRALKQDPGKLLWWKPALLHGLAEGLPKSEGKLGVKSLAEFTKKPSEAFKEAAAEIAALLAQVDKVMTDSAAPLEQRLAVIPLLSQRPWNKAEPLMRALLADGQPQEISTAAIAMLRKYSSDKTAPLLYELLPKVGPAARRDVATMLASGKTLLDFLQRMDRGEVSKSLLGAEQRWGIQRSKMPEIKTLADKLFSQPSTDRAAVIASYMPAIKMKGDAARGHQLFTSVCIACHVIKGEGEGVEVGPDITDVRIKEKEALLSDILDPNRICEPRFMAYLVDTKDGRFISGIMSSESSESVTLKLAGGATENIPRSNIAKVKCLDQSLMPVGLEAGFTKEQMADLLAFLKGE